MSSFECHAYGVKDASKSTVVEHVTIKRRPVGPNDAHIKILASSICHSDLHFLRGDWDPNMSGTHVPGHEIVGIIERVGENVDTSRIGQYVGIGCFTGANCTQDNGSRSCSSCVDEKDERFCEKGTRATYDMDSGTELIDGVVQPTFGGFSTDIVVDAHFAVPVPEYFQSPDKIQMAPSIMCAGTTLFSALLNGGCKAGQKVAISGVGGLGMYGILIAKAFGADVYAFTRSESKKQDLLDLGCKVIISTDAEEMKKFNGFFELIVDTIGAEHEIEQLLGCLKPKGKLGLLGAPSKFSFSPWTFLMRQISVYGTPAGSIQHSADALELCAKHEICVPVELIHPKDIEVSFDRMLKSDVKYRFAIDIEAMRRGE